MQLRFAQTRKKIQKQTQENQFQSVMSGFHLLQSIQFNFLDLSLLNWCSDQILVNYISNINRKKMDFDKLGKKINKEPLKWTRQDVAIWLDFVGLHSLIQRFGIDGSCLGQLEPVDLQQELMIKSNITKKKLMNWIQSGLKQFSQYLQKNKQNISNINAQIQVEKDQYADNGEMVDQSLITSQNSKEKKQLIITPYEGNQSSFFCVGSEGGRIGRHSTNNILILEQSISRFHAQIIYDKGDFFLQDIGSTTGTYTKVVDKIVLTDGIIIEMGSYQFFVKSTITNSIDGFMELLIIEGVTSEPTVNIQFRNGFTGPYSIGRKNTNQLYFEDHHLSGIHSRIYFINGQFILQDMSSTNGTWIRLSKEGAKSNLFKLDYKTIFKVGSNSTYICKKQVTYETEADKPMVIKQQGCIVCYDNDRDALYFPCKHNVSCVKCSKNLLQCPVCRIKITDTIKIYKA